MRGGIRNKLCLCNLFLRDNSTNRGTALALRLPRTRLSSAALIFKMSISLDRHLINGLRRQKCQSVKGTPHVTTVIVTKVTASSLQIIIFLIIIDV